MKTINIDFDYLLFAYRDDSSDNIYYLDTEYGDVRLVHRGLKDLRDLTDEIEISHDRFLYIPKGNKEESLADLHAFFDKIEDPQIKKVLVVAFESPHVLDTFKKILAQHPALNIELEDYLKERTKERVLSWLEANALCVAAEQTK